MITFKYFFNAGFDRVTGECDVEGTDVFEDGHYIGSIRWKTPNDLAQMEYDELEEIFAQNYIMTNSDLEDEVGSNVINVV